MDSSCPLFRTGHLEHDESKGKTQAIRLFGLAPWND